MISKYLKGFLKFMDRLEVVRLKVLDEIGPANRNSSKTRVKRDFCLPEVEF